MEEEAGKPFVQRHLGVLRAWKKPEGLRDAGTASQPAGQMVAKELQVPKRVADPGSRYSRSYASFQQYLKESSGNK